MYNWGSSNVKLTLVDTLVGFLVGFFVSALVGAGVGFLVGCACNTCFKAKTVVSCCRFSCHYMMYQSQSDSWRTFIIKDAFNIVWPAEPYIAKRELTSTSPFLPSPMKLSVPTNAAAKEWIRIARCRHASRIISHEWCNLRVVCVFLERAPLVFSNPLSR